MRHYNIYLIEDEVAQAYFNEESKLFKLFLEAEKEKSPQQLETLQKQINYITRVIPVLQIKQNIDEALRHRDDYTVSPQAYLLDIVGNQSNAKLKLTENRVVMMASGGFEAETTFFEMLRKVDPCFLAMEFRQHRCGWLNPIKQTHFIQAP